MEHPLQDSWNFIFSDKNEKVWEDRLKTFGKASTIEEFFKIYNRLPVISNILTGYEIHIFKRNLKPCWEDKELENGGRWYVDINKERADEIFQIFVFAFIGFQIEDSSLCGISIARKDKNSKIFVWTSNVDINFGKSLKNLLKTKENIQFATHKQPRINLFKV